MSDPPSEDRRDAELLSAELTARICDLVGSVVARSLENVEHDFEHLLGRSRDLYERKASMLGTKSETRDLLVETVFSRLRRTFRSFCQSDDSMDEIKTAEWVLGAVVGGSAMGEFASALDSVILRTSSPQDYSFAGRADFIDIEDVMQMLGSGKHRGRLSLEKHDNRIDVYIDNGLIVFLEPHHLVRRVLPGTNSMNYREISREQMKQAEAAHAREGVPLLLALEAMGCFKNIDTRQVLRELGCEVLFDFLRQQDQCTFFYRKLDELPDFAREYDLRLPVTPILLEGNKRLDDWRNLRKVFPDPQAPIEPMPDMHAQISHLALGVLEIKMLAQIDGENSAKNLSEMMGLPLLEVYQHLFSFAREGAVRAPGGFQSLEELGTTVEESMQIAFEALDANDDNLAVTSALDKILGGSEDDGAFGEGGLFSGGGAGGTGEGKVSLDFLNEQ